MLVFIGYFFMWLGYILLAILALLVILALLPIKVDLYYGHEEKWAQVRCLFLKYRISLDSLEDLTRRFKKADKTPKEGKSPQQDTGGPPQDVHLHKKTVSSPKDEPLKKGSIHPEGESREAVLSHSGKAGIPHGPESKNHSWDPPQAPQAPPLPDQPGPLPLPRAAQVPSLSEKYNPSYWLAQYQLFKGMYKDGQRVLPRLLKRISFHRVETTLAFSIDDPYYNAQLYGHAWAAEALVHRVLCQHFRKVRRHSFKVESSFKGYSFDVQARWTLGFCLAGLISALVLSLKDLLAIRKKWNSRGKTPA